MCLQSDLISLNVFRLLRSLKKVWQYPSLTHWRPSGDSLLLRIQQWVLRGHGNWHGINFFEISFPVFLMESDKKIRGIMHLYFCSKGCLWAMICPMTDQIRWLWNPVFVRTGDFMISFKTLNAHFFLGFDLLQRTTGIDYDIYNRIGRKLICLVFILCVW